VKKALVVVLIVLVVATGLPILMGMPGMAVCHDCGPALVSASCGLAILAAGVAFMLTLLSVRHRSRGDITRLLLHSFLLERPPRLA